MDQRWKSVMASVHNEGEEGVKWELGFALFLTGKLGLAFLGLGCLKVGMGNKILNGIGMYKL